MTFEPKPVTKTMYADSRDQLYDTVEQAVQSQLGIEVRQWANGAFRVPANSHGIAARMVEDQETLAKIFCLVDGAPKVVSQPTRKPSQFCGDQLGYFSPSEVRQSLRDRCLLVAQLLRRDSPADQVDYELRQLEETIGYFRETER